jgi:hypothetical protein
MCQNPQDGTCCISSLRHSEKRFLKLLKYIEVSKAVPLLFHVDGWTYKPIGRFRIYFLSEPLKSAINIHDPENHISEMGHARMKPPLSERRRQEKIFSFLYESAE